MCSELLFVIVCGADIEDIEAQTRNETFPSEI